MASSVGQSSSTTDHASSPDILKSVDCPVCFRVFKNPKSLVCGHSFCEVCCNQLQQNGRTVQCPTCRSRTNVPSSGLPTNYSLAELVSMVVKADSAPFSCATCSKKCEKTEVWLCHGCSNAILCAVCSLKHHKGHHLQEMSDLLASRQREIDTWSTKIAPRVSEIENEDKEISRTSMQIAANVACISALLDQGTNWAKEGRREIKKEFRNFKSDFDKFVTEGGCDKNLEFVVSAVDMDIVTQEQIIDSFNQKQKNVMDKQKQFLTMLHDFEAQIRRHLGPVACREATSKRKRVRPLRLCLNSSGGSRGRDPVIQLDSDEDVDEEARNREDRNDPYGFLNQHSPPASPNSDSNDFIQSPRPTYGRRRSYFPGLNSGASASASRRSVRRSHRPRNPYYSDSSDSDPNVPTSSRGRRSVSPILSTFGPEISQAYRNRLTANRSPNSTPSPYSPGTSGLGEDNSNPPYSPSPVHNAPYSPSPAHSFTRSSVTPPQRNTPTRWEDDMSSLSDDELGPPPQRARYDDQPEW